MARRKKNILEELESLDKDNHQKTELCEESDDDFSDLDLDEAKEKETEVADNSNEEDAETDEPEETDEAADELVDDLDDEVADLADDVEKDDMLDFKNKLNQILDSLADLKSAINGEELADDDAVNEESVDDDLDSLEDDDLNDDETQVDTNEGEDEDLYQREDFSPLMRKEGLTEEFQKKANNIFNAVLQEKVLMVAEKIATKANSVVNKKVKKLIETVVEDVNDYFDYVVEEWMIENELAVEQGIRNNLIENVLFKFKKALAESYIELPEEDLLMIEELEKKTTTLQGKLDSALTENIKLRKHLIESKKTEILNSLTEGLTVADVDRFKKLSKSVDYESMEQYKASLKSLKESVLMKESDTPVKEVKTVKTPGALTENVKTETAGYIDIQQLDPTRMFTDVIINRSEKVNDYISHLNRAAAAKV